MIPKLSQTLGAVVILGLFGTGVAAADPATASNLPPDATAASTAATTDLAQGSPLDDVPANSWAYDAVQQLTRDGIIKGYPDHTFKGSRPMTRYEASVLAYRALHELELRITAGKPIPQPDMDAANKLLAAYGRDLKAVEANVATLKQEADATKREADSNVAQLGALTAFSKKAYFKFTDYYREFAYGGNVNINCGPGVYAPGSATSVQTYCANTGGGNALLHGVKAGGFGPSVGDEPPGTNFANGQNHQGLGFNYMKLSFTGTPSPYTAFLVELSNSTRMDDTSGKSSTTGYCDPSQNYLNGNSSEPSTLTNCSVVDAKQAAYNTGEPGFLASMNNVWFQQEIPNSGLYLRVGHVQENEGNAHGILGGDYFWGGMLGLTKGQFNGYVAYGSANSAVTNNTLDNIPGAAGKFAAEADYTLPLGRGTVNVGGLYINYAGTSTSEWDPSAVMCTSGSSTRYFANTAAVPFTTCGAGFTPITYANGTLLTGAYLSQAANNPTATPAGSFGTPGLSVSQNVSMVGGHLVFDFKNASLYLGGTYRLGDDPYTGSSWVGPLSGFYDLTFGPSHSERGNRGKFTYDTQGLAVGFNAQTPATNDFGGPVLENSWNTNMSGLFWMAAFVKYWTSDDSTVGIGYGHVGLLPNTELPAGSPTCPGCVVTGFNQNAGYLEFSLSF